MSYNTQAGSANMERSDSGPGAQAGPSSMIKDGPWSFQSLGSVPAFKPFVQGTPMNFLNADSVPDATKSTFSMANPIGKGTSPPSSPPGRVNDLVEGPPFTTDTDMGWSATRFVRVGGFPAHWLDNGHLVNSLEQSGISEEIISHAMQYENPNTLALYLWFDDLRAAVASQDKISMIHSTGIFMFIDHHIYFGVDHECPRAAAVSAYDGQIEFAATHRDGLRGFELRDAFKQVSAFSKTFGEIRSFEYMEGSEVWPVHFRAEYFSLAAAENAVKSNEVKHKVFVSDTYTATIQQYLPPGYRRYAHPALNSIDNLEARFQNLEVLPDQLASPHSIPFQESSTKRTAWNGGKALIRQYPGAPEDFSPPHGGRQPFESPRRGRGGNGMGPRGNGRGGKWGWMIPKEDSNLWKIDNKKWIKNQPQTVDLEKIERGIDVRTTVMLRNIPNRTQFEDLKDYLDETSYGEYDFSYLRIDFSNNCNVGYAFVNFTRPEHIVTFVNRRVGKAWGIFNSEKRCEVSYATIQGIDCLLAKFRNSVVMEEYPGFRPKLWYTYESNDIPADLMVGDEAPFPPPNNEQKRKRSRDNASTVGLFPPRYGKGHGHRDAHFRDGKFDRGTPHAIEEERRYEETHHLSYYDEGQSPIDFNPADDQRFMGFHNNSREFRPGSGAHFSSGTFTPYGNGQSPGYSNQIDPRAVQPPIRR